MAKDVDRSDFVFSELSSHSTENLQKITDVYLNVWGGKEELVLDKTKWAFDNKFSKLVVAKYENEIIGVRGGIAWELQDVERKMQVYQFHGTCVLADYRRMGLFSSMNKAFIKSSKLEKKGLIFNVSVLGSRLGYEKLGWKYIKGFRRLSRFRKPLFLLKNRGDFRKEGLTIPSDSNVTLDPHTDLIKSRNVSLNGLVHSPYTSKFLNWRFRPGVQGHRIFSLENIGIIIYKLVRRGQILELLIGDIFLQEYNGKRLSLLLKRLYEFENPHMVYTYIFKNHPLYRLMLSKLLMPNPFNYDANFGIKTLDPQLGPLLNENKWGLTFFEIDTF